MGPRRAFPMLLEKGEASGKLNSSLSPPLSSPRSRHNNDPAVFTLDIKELSPANIGPTAKPGKRATTLIGRKDGSLTLFSPDVELQSDRVSNSIHSRAKVPSQK